MRLHSLSLSAFGPFAGTETVDVDDVARDGLFLLWGPTGAGKTTLLDAVVFALYGTVPGARGEEKRLRSDHAGAATRTEVSLELTLAGERLLVVRRPEQTRPKKRGVGETTEQAKLLVQRWDGGTWEPVSTRIDEGSEYLRERLGLSAEQFCQVVLLPQGDFARFLRAEPEDRARLLRTLFDVGRFARAEDWLAAERRAAEETLRADRHRISTLLHRVAQIADVDVPEELAPELVGAHPGTTVGSWVNAVRGRAAARQTRAAAEAEAAAAAGTRLDAELADARAVAARHDRRARAREELARLAEREEQLTPLRARADAGRRAEGLRDVLDAAARSARDAGTAATALASARTAWAAVSDGRDADLLLARELRDDAATARALVPEAERADGLVRELARLERDVEALTARCDEGARAAQAWPGRVAEAQQRLDEALAAAAQLPGLTAADGAARTALAAANAAERVAADLDTARAVADAARVAWLEAREELVELRAARLDGMAAELATGLVPGADCPVCGATEHPRPALPTGRAVSADDEERARAAADVAEARAAATRQAADERERELAVLRARAAELPVAELAVRAAEARAALDEVAARAGAAGDARRALAAAESGRDAAAAALAAGREELQRCTTARAAREEALRELTARLDAARGTDADLPARVHRLTTAAERCEAVVGAEAEELRARAAAGTARRTAAERAAAAGFPDLLDAAGALLRNGELPVLEQRIREHDEARAVAVAALADPELTDLPDRPDLPALQERCAALTARREEAVAALDQARRCAGALDALAGEVVAAEVELAERRAWAGQVTGLADLVTGRGANTLRMRLQSFVLAARLEQVAEVASRRLQDMSGARYTFLHSDAQGRHGARGGLGLDVFDEYTGTRRPTKTLSGGESFMASLALALGLADVVTAEAGGVQMDTLFVDEGFGTLDAQALDAVMNVLDELRRGGRTVGVISHLEELRTRIPTRLEVVAGRHGSRLAG
ncbi:AAA family ATPase [Geodermatophilus sabuli]|uniref:Nuclease SbcCD subunit C n=1 Tax=Geodermatophilus sabuli TaxID=1564158 RepID=A0A285EC83_9ACTN|nr:SMC family ATPase [Geodermatophilus sabuli]MBB3084788.1 exonuclease SbcC [Geodermatophilus sabuli]SNX95804.1 exonuclease SbcC [Geodermatophilus sabuli]